MSEGRDLYLQTLGAAGTDKKDARKAALERAHAIREFEIELYWKRANYFWLLQAAVFAAVGLTWKAERSALPQILPIGLASLGVITAWAGWLASQGSKFWQRNWEHHIDMLEGEFEGDLYKTVYVNWSGAKWSLTGVSESLALCFTVFWVLVLGIASFSINSNWSLSPADLAWPPRWIEVETFASWCLAGVGVVFLFRQKTGIKGNIVDYPEEMNSQGQPMASPKLRRDRNARPFLVRREPSIDIK
ncbi:MAG TPA: hypothetical protein VF605_10025 [Allosphingosinicella sp.]|jgi:hypothetical protein